VIRFHDVTKRYSLSGLTSAGFKDLILHLPRHLRNRRKRRSFCALDGVSFDVAAGECLGIIGRNGSGKSTTLGLIAGVLRPTAGSVETQGRICPLLELGAGFHEELSGQENIILNGILLGLTRREVTERIEEIIDFSELREFIHHPIRVYSSGMVARLGFSVMAHLDPEILLIDEVLAVGDNDFQRKCLRKMAEFRQNGVTMVFVSHGMADVRKVCDRVALLDAGRLVSIGPPGHTILRYERLLRSKRAAERKERSPVPGPPLLP